MTKPKTLYLIRHGQTEYNKQNIIQGSGIDSDLNSTGKMQAQRFYEYYKQEGFEMVFTSKLKRTVQSVSQFLQTGLPHEMHEGLNEINWGVLEGTKSTNEQRMLFEKMVADWRKGNLHQTVDGGETPLDMQQRQTVFLNNLLQQENEKILIASHGRALRSFICLLTGTPLSQMHLYSHTNLGLYVLEQVDEQRFEIKLKNSTQHLTPDLITPYYK